MKYYIHKTKITGTWIQASWTEQPSSLHNVLHCFLNIKTKKVQLIHVAYTTPEITRRSFKTLLVLTRVNCKVLFTKTLQAHWWRIRYDTRCYFNVQSKADMSYSPPFLHPTGDPTPIMSVKGTYSGKIESLDRDPGIATLGPGMRFPGN